MSDLGPSSLELVDRDTGIPLSEAVFRSLCQALRAGIYRPGDRLREEEVAQRLKVSRTPVREAFGRLLAKGFVEPAGGRGLIVRSLDTAEVLELYAMREILEGAAARLAAQHASLPEIDALKDLEQAFEANLDDPVEMARLNQVFHETIFRAARNRYLDSALQELQDGISLLGSTTFSVGGRPSTAAEEHRGLIDAIASRNPDLAEKLARTHIQEALRSRLRLMQNR
jgi:DNA-binding GntR family transcriptional regulator